MVLKTIALVCFIIASSNALECRFNPPTYQGLDFDRYIGTWYLKEFGPLLVDETFPFRCVSEINHPTNVSLVYNFNWHGETLEGEKLHQTGAVVQLDPADRAQFSNFFDNTVIHGKVVATDYENWAIEYNCHPIYQERFMVRSRTTGLNSQVRNVLLNMLTSFGADVRQFISVDQNNCTVPII